MPTNRRYRTKQRQQQIDELNGSLEYDLLHGSPFFSLPGCEFEDLDLMCKAWRLHRDELRTKWTATEPPGTRCFAEWCFELVPKYGERRTTKYWNEHHEEFRDQHLKHGILHTHTIPAMQEPEHEYLRRHEIINDAEYQAAVEHEDEHGIDNLLDTSPA